MAEEDRHQLTMRLDIGTWEKLDELLLRYRVPATALVEAFARQLIEADEIPAELVDEAQLIDTERRRRRGAP